ncbi:long-chain-fatty-acid--CoA ligase 3-like [Gigantopelta aegis]|uniref:long-chain-fatty-acid--CoA ligase 3-like n=1 Tax=Gigantopelta aegis TaxID=1735272 RepID=UPI001B88CCB4|nr:long-chain-fatty-acid--CoA ligase 3-like [Gigantopelta aegis]
MTEVWISAVVGLLKAVCFVVDVISYIPCYFIYRPDKVLKQSRRTKAVRVADGQSVAYRSVEVKGQLITTLFPECRTLDDLFERAVRLSAIEPCLGTRELLKEEDKLQPNGRVFKKVFITCILSSL